MLPNSLAVALRDDLESGMSSRRRQWRGWLPALATAHGTPTGSVRQRSIAVRRRRAELLGIPCALRQPVQSVSTLLQVARYIVRARVAQPLLTGLPSGHPDDPYAGRQPCFDILRCVADQHGGIAAEDDTGPLAAALLSEGDQSRPARAVIAVRAAGQIQI